MKILVKSALIVSGIAALSACSGGTKEQTANTESPAATEAAMPAPETPAPEATSGQPKDEWVAKPDSGVPVNVPDTPVSGSPPTAPADSKH